MEEIRDENNILEIDDDNLNDSNNEEITFYQTTRKSTNQNVLNMFQEGSWHKFAHLFNHLITSLKFNLKL